MHMNVCVHVYMCARALKDTWFRLKNLCASASSNSCLVSCCVYAKSSLLCSSDVRRLYTSTSRKDFNH